MPKNPSATPDRPALIVICDPSRAGSPPTPRHPLNWQNTTPAFEVASVKPTAPDASGPMKMQRVAMMAGDRVIVNNVTLRVLVANAYPTDEIEGGPGWGDTDRFDVEAKATAPASLADRRLMLRTLLAERFNFVAHMTKKTESVYALVFARAGKTFGPKLRPATEDCATRRSKVGPGRSVMPCGTMANAGITGVLNGYGLTMRDLAGFLARDVGRPVVDRTGLTGPFDWEMTYTPQSFLQGPFNRERFPQIDPDGPSSFTALQEQLGLKLEPAKDDRDVLVIDRAEHPTPD